MTEQENVNIEQKQPEAQVQNQQPAQVQTQAQPEETPDQINWRKFREQREIDRKQREAAEKIAAEEKAKAEALKAAMDALLNKPQSNDHQINQNYEESDEQRIEKLVASALDKERRRVQEEKIKQEAAELPQKLAQSCPGFDMVCNATNIDYLEYHYPEVVAGYRYMPEGLEKWQAIYKAVKKFVPQTDPKKDQARVDNNLKKPQSLHSTSTLQGTTSPGPNILTEERRAANWERMQKTIKGLS